ncbi:MAG TPA: long-chain fatty acid--CoA ligase [Candidatus Binatia bacterium]|nr:long-chain fatty acid--CoA ligase [Candidatus Binatia bacterium]
MRSTMQDRPLTVAALLEHGAAIYGDSRVLTWTGGGFHEASFATVAARARRLAAGLARLGVAPGDRVATFCWNGQAHLEAYLAVPAMGAVLHTLNVRLFPEQVAFVATHASDRVVLVDDALLPVLARALGAMPTVERVIVIGDGDASALGRPVIRYAELLAAEEPRFTWPDCDERSAAAMCYTSGTTGDPKGVVYSHRSTYLHSLAACAGSTYALSEHDRILLIVPMFHANGWGLPYAGWLTGADLVLPGRFLQAEPLCELIAALRPTVAAAVPTIWNDILRHGEAAPIDLSSLRLVVCGGSAVPRSLMERFEERYGVRIVQAWGMTETSPMAALALPPKGTPPEEAMRWRAKTGRIVPGIELRVVDAEGRPMPWDGRSAGEIEVRGPWVTGGYYREDAPEKFHDGWLRTGDVGTVDGKGFVQITDRVKDVIKSGGEWISSVELEGHIMAHPDVLEAAVIGIPDPRWDERPLACVVPRPGARLTPEALRAFLAARVAKWWLPERWAFVDAVPRTSVGKFDKKALRALWAAGGLAAIDAPAAR